MLFYEDLVRKIEEEKIENIEKIEKFKLNGTKSLVGYGIAIPLILIGLFEVYSYRLRRPRRLRLGGGLGRGFDPRGLALPSAGREREPQPAHDEEDGDDC